MDQLIFISGEEMVVLFPSLPAFLRRKRNKGYFLWTKQYIPKYSLVKSLKKVLGKIFSKQK
jgi:hypothetical protein